MRKKYFHQQFCTKTCKKVLFFFNTVPITKTTQRQNVDTSTQQREQNAHVCMYNTKNNVAINEQVAVSVQHFNENYRVFKNFELRVRSMKFKGY